MTPLVLILLLTDMQINLAPEKVVKRGRFGKMWCVSISNILGGVSSVLWQYGLWSFQMGVQN